jgi:glutathione peroxidase
LAFPCNDFDEGEPGSDKKIKDFARRTYEITFPLMSKVSVRGADASPFYRYLTGKKGNPQLAGEIDGNFAKFLINRKGLIV